MKIKKYEITEELENKLKICYFKNKKFFIFGNDVLPKTYLLIPFEITAKIVFPHMIFNFAPHEEKKALNFFFFFDKQLSFTKKIFFRKIIFKGLGFKSFLLENGTILRLKVGFSHFIDLKIPVKKLKVVLRKNVIHAISFNRVILGTFCQKIKFAKRPNCYTGKGFWHKREIRHIKSFKKK